MPRYHFHIRENDHYIADEEGHECANGDAARREAVETVAALAQDAFVAGSARSVTVDVTEGDVPYLRVSVSLDVSKP